MLQTDFLILGSGIAGLRGAITLAKNHRVIVISKGKLLEGSSLYAQGGIAVPLDDDDVTIHYDDTIKAGSGLSSTEAVNILVQEGKAVVQELIDWGAKFDMANTTWAFAKEAAHSQNRVIHAGGDATGREVMHTLFREASRYPNIIWQGGLFGIDLILEDGICKGVTVLEESTDNIFSIRARAVLLATGGSGQVYARTTNPMNATGDGIAMAYRAAAKIEDLEFVQFHPTTLCYPSSPQFLISEAMRGEGAILKTITGEHFMSRYHSAADLAPRDIVTRALWEESQKTGIGYVLLDITHRDPHYVRNRFPTIYTTCLKYGLDITTTAIPVFPSAHYMMGGVSTDVMGATTIPGLYAAGEVACNGIHGANRLASNSLLEGLVFGKRAAQNALSFNPDSIYHTDTINSQTAGALYLDKNSLSNKPTQQIQTDLQAIMWGKVGIVREKTTLREAAEQLDEWKNKLGIPSSNRKSLELENLITVAQCITKAALSRKESIGAHYRTDFPNKTQF